VWYADFFKTDYVKEYCLPETEKNEAAKKYKKNINIIQGDVKFTYFLRNQLDPKNPLICPMFFV
jgi:hypothetical protein